MNKNEQLKIKANFWNGLAIAAAIAGFVVPMLNAYGDDQIWKATIIPPSAVGWKLLWPMLAGIFFAVVFRSIAVSIAGLIRDNQ